MNTIRHIRRFAVVLAGLAAAVVAFATPAFAVNYPLPIDPGTSGGTSTAPAPVVHTVIVGGMPGWQIALIAAGAALVAATAALLFERARSGQHKPATATA
jgi:hypothetical protein